MVAGRLPVKIIVVGSRIPAGLEGMDCALLADSAGARFDNSAETWIVTASDGTQFSAGVVVDTRPSTDPSVANHGRPNYFRIPGPDVRAQSRYVQRCLRVIQRSGAARMESRKNRIKARRFGPVANRFYLSGAEPGPDELYDGPATVTVGDREIAGRVRLTGHLDAIDGRYHWQGTVFDTLPDAARGRSAGVTLTIEDRTVAARVVEQTPWGTHMIAGVGDPPFER